METSELHKLTVAGAARLIGRQELSPLELTRAVLREIEHHDARLNAFITILSHEALAEAQQAEKEIAAGRYRGPLHGIPISLKDLFATRGVRTTAGSRILADWVPDYDATVTARLREAGAVLVGKTNLHEFAFGVSTENPHYGPTRNPWDEERIPGGSSGGSGAAVAASMSLASMGTDTGGSIRIPSAFCGIVGLKPTYGRVSRYGVIPLSWSLDHAGPMTKSVEDAALMLNAIAGRDPLDPTSADLPVPDYTASLADGARGLRLGIPRQHFFQMVDDEVLGAVKKALSQLEEAGATLEEVSLPHVSYAGAVVQAVLTPEAAAYHEPNLRARPQDYGADVRGRLESGRFLLATDYLAGQRARQLIVEDFRQALTQVDLIATPTLAITAPRIGQKTVRVGDRTLDGRFVITRCTNPINLVGLPAISVPCGLSSAGLPIGLQLVGRPFDESTVLRAAHAYESQRGALILRR